MSTMPVPGFCTACNIRPSLPVPGFHFCEVCAVRHAAATPTAPTNAIPTNIPNQPNPDRDQQQYTFNIPQMLPNNTSIPDVSALAPPSAPVLPSASPVPSNPAIPNTSTIANNLVSSNRDRRTFPDLLQPPLNPALFLCDIQDSVRRKIFSFYSVVNTSLRMLRYANALDIPVFVTEQKPTLLGGTASELLGDVAKLGPLHVGTFTKTTFSMMTPGVRTSLAQRNIQSVLIVGVEAHLSILQTVLDLLRSNIQVYVLTDGVSSHTTEETGVALDRMERAGAIMTTSESIIFEILGDTDRPIAERVFSLSKSSRPVNVSALRSLLGDGDEDHGPGFNSMSMPMNGPPRRNRPPY
ncbi:hypothetical protein FRC20_004254 [Serendipita sp. 405]|nr:hypothetical protein FRC18_009181 [Serendipita sp. 400]KAG8842775.1 hypothetical protein FRC20_004254 [Serendipita sp. 405]